MAAIRAEAVWIVPSLARERALRLVPADAQSAVVAASDPEMVSALELALLRRNYPELRELLAGHVAMRLRQLVRAARDRGAERALLEALSWLLHQRAGSSFAYDTEPT